MLGGREALDASPAPKELTVQQGRQLISGLRQPGVPREQLAAQQAQQAQQGKPRGGGLELP